MKTTEQLCSSQESNAENETAYERLLRKVNEKKRLAAKEGDKVTSAVRKVKTVTEVDKNSKPKQGKSQAAECWTSFEEENNYVDMGVSGDFLSGDKEASSMEVEDSQNNNATRSEDVTEGHSNRFQTTSPERSPSPLRGDDDQTEVGMSPGKNVRPNVESDLGKRLELIQGFMAKKGLIDVNMSNDQLKRFLEQNEGSINEPNAGTQRESRPKES